jgi:23S rRNA (adenine-N6)-dimethyltransferase
MPTPISVSQNFLTSKTVIRRILNRTDLCKGDSVIEIGPGKGHITRELARRCGSVTAVELDGGLYAKLKASLTQDNVRLHRGDFLRWNLPVNGAYKIFSNIPFSITSDIIRRLTMCPNPPSDAWLVMEKGAAKRFMGHPNDTRRSLAIKPFFDMRITYHFRRSDFHPMPGADCVLVHIARRETPDLPMSKRGQFARFVETRSGTMLYVQWLCLFRRTLGR